MQGVNEAKFLRLTMQDYADFDITSMEDRKRLFTLIQARCHTLGLQVCDGASVGPQVLRIQVLRREYDAKEAKVIEQQRQSQAVLSPQGSAVQGATGTAELGHYAPDPQRGDRRDLSRSRPIPQRAATVAAPRCICA